MSFRTQWNEVEWSEKSLVPSFISRQGEDFADTLYPSSSFARNDINWANFCPDINYDQASISYL